METNGSYVALTLPFTCILVHGAASQPSVRAGPWLPAAAGFYPADQDDRWPRRRPSHRAPHRAPPGGNPGNVRVLCKNIMGGQRRGAPALEWRDAYLVHSPFCFCCKNSLIHVWCLLVPYRSWSSRRESRRSPAAHRPLCLPPPAARRRRLGARSRCRTK